VRNTILPCDSSASVRPAVIPRKTAFDKSLTIRPITPLCPPRRGRLAVAHESQLFDGLINPLAGGAGDAPLPPQHQRYGTHRDARRLRDIIDGDFLR
jgi:hypothetical protein